MSNSDIAATIYLERISSKSYDTKVFFWEEKQFFKSDKEYQRTFANVYPVEALGKVQNLLDLPTLPEDKYGRLYFYGNDSNYELFIFDGGSLNNHQWNLILLEEDKYQEIIVSKDNAYELLDGYQIKGDVIYLFSHFYNNDDINNDASVIIHEIDRKSGKINRMEVPVDIFE